jgi:hypothetical protein
MKKISYIIFAVIMLVSPFLVYAEEQGGKRKKNKYCVP